MNAKLKAVEDIQWVEPTPAVQSIYDYSEPEDDQDLESVQAIAEGLDLVRVMCSEVSMATLLAEIREVPEEVVSVVLRDLAIAGERAVAILREASGVEPVPSVHIAEGPRLGLVKS